MRKKSTPTTVAHEPKLKKSKPILRKRKIDVAREPHEYTASKLTLSKAKDISDLTLSANFSKVRLNAQKTSGSFCKLNLVNAIVFNAETNWILLTTTNNAFGEASVAYKATAAGENFLVRYFIDVISDNSEFQISTFGGSSPTHMTLNAGSHEIPIVAVANAAGDHAVQMLLKTVNRSYYLHAIEIEPL